MSLSVAIQASLGWWCAAGREINL